MPNCLGVGAAAWLPDSPLVSQDQLAAAWLPDSPLVVHPVRLANMPGPEESEPFPLPCPCGQRAMVLIADADAALHDIATAIFGVLVASVAFA